MNNNINSLVEETLNSFDNIQKVDAPFGIEQKILHRLHNTNITKGRFRIINYNWLIAALVIGIICNVYFAISYNQKSNDSNTESTNISSFESHFRLVDNTSLLD